MELYAWLGRIGYRSYFSGIGLNAECPNLLIRNRLNESIDKAREETGRKVHLIGHSLGGVIARAAARQRRADIASVITLASPFRGAAAQKNILRAAEIVRQNILRQHGSNVLPECYTGRCTCEFLCSLRRDLPSCVTETAIYTKSDSVVDWRYCVTGDEDVDVEVSGTHLGLVFNPTVYSIIANRLSQVDQQK
jgi:PGAP1-like protein